MVFAESFSQEAHLENFCYSLSSEQDTQQSSQQICEEIIVGNDVNKDDKENNNKQEGAL